MSALATEPTRPDTAADAFVRSPDGPGRIGARNSTQTTFGHLLARHRRSRGFSQPKLAKRCDLDHSFLSRLESGNRNPSRDAVDRLIDALELTDSDAVAFRSAAGFLNAGDGVVMRPVLTEIDQALSDPALPDDVATSVRRQLDDIKRILTAVIGRETEKAA